MQARRYLAIPALAALLVAGVVAASGGSGSPTRPAASVTRPGSVPVAQRDAEVRMANAIYNGQILDYTIAVDAAAEWAAIELLAENYVPPPPPPPAAAPRRLAAFQGTPPAVSGACGGATNGADRFIGRESGGNPNARNASGAWGCYQIMPGTWSSSCSDLGQHGSASTQAQAQCASRLPSSAWAASGG